MSDWSSFPNDKKLTDSWRQFLTENEEELEEGWEDIYGGIIGYGKKKLGLGGDEEEEEAAASTLSKETPLSILKSAPGQTEKPLVAQLQHLGLSQSTAQQIAKRIGKYLRQRKLTIAEINTTDSLIRSTFVGKTLLPFLLFDMLTLFVAQLKMNITKHIKQKKCLKFFILNFYP